MEIYTVQIRYIQYRIEDDKSPVDIDHVEGRKMKHHNRHHYQAKGREITRQSPGIQGCMLFVGRGSRIPRRGQRGKRGPRRVPYAIHMPRDVNLRATARLPPIVHKARECTRRAGIPSGVLLSFIVHPSDSLLQRPTPPFLSPPLNPSCQILPSLDRLLCPLSLCYPCPIWTTHNCQHYPYQSLAQPLAQLIGHTPPRPPPR